MSIQPTNAQGLLSALQARLNWWAKREEDGRGWRRDVDRDRHETGSLGRFQPRFRHGVPEFPVLRGERAAHGDGAAGREKLDLSAWSLEGTTDTALTITTDEGDVVSISRATDMDMSYASLKYKSRDEDGMTKVSGKSREFSYSESISLTVEGDLNDEEMADIEKLLDRIGPALEQFRSEGEMSGVLSVNGDEFESLAGYEFTFQQTWDFTAVQARLRERARMTAPDAPEQFGFRLGPPPAGWFDGESVESVFSRLERPEA